MASSLLTESPGVLFTLKITDTSAHDVAGNANYPVTVYWIACTNITTNTPALTLAIYDGTNTTYLRNALATSAKERVVFDYPIPLPKASYLRVVSSAANEIDVVGAASLPKA